MIRLKFVDFIAESNNPVDVQIGESFTIELLSLNHNSRSWKILGIKYVLKRRLSPRFPEISYRLRWFLPKTALAGGITVDCGTLEDVRESTRTIILRIVSLSSLILDSNNDLTSSTEVAT
jgi:hypothetical protein